MKRELSHNCRIFLPALAVLILLAACNVPGISPEAAIPPSFVQESREAAQNVQDAHLRLELEWSTPVLADKQVLEVWYVRPDKIRLEIVESAQPGFQDIIFASQGEQGWMYRHAARQVDTGPVSAVRPAVVYDVATSLLSILFENSFQEIETITRDYVSGKRAFKLTGRSGPEILRGAQNDVASDCSVWLEENSLLPLKVQRRGQTSIEYTAVIRAAEYNIGLTDDLFDIEFLPTQAYTIHRSD